MSLFPSQYTHFEAVSQSILRKLIIVKGIILFQTDFKPLFIVLTCKFIIKGESFLNKNCASPFSLWNLRMHANSDLSLAKEIRDGVTWQQMKLFIGLPGEETGFYLMRLEVVLHLADFNHVRNSICSRLTKWFVASVNKYCHFLFSPHSVMRDTIS